MKLLIASLATGVAADCDGSPCQLLSVTTPGRLEETEMEADPQLNVNTFTAVDKCATSEVRDLTGWVLAYYEDVSNQLDVSFSNILTTARLANSALRYLGALSSELQAFQRIQNISTEMNAMLRTCLADAMHLSASMQRCDLSFSHDNFGVDAVTTTGGDDINSVWITPKSTNAEGTCLGALCEHVAAWNATCGDQGFAADLERIAAAHDLEGSKYAFAANRESSFHTPPKYLYSDGDDAATFAILNEDLFTQESALLHRVKLWVEVQFNGMMVLVRKALNGGQFAQSSDLTICEKHHETLDMDTVQWLSLAFEKCEGSMVRTWLKVSPLNREYMTKLVETLAEKIPNVFKPGKPGVLFGGLTTNFCKKFQDIEPEIKAEIQKLQDQHTAMNDGSGDPRAVNTFYLNPVASTKDGALSAFGPETKSVEQWGPASEFLKAPFAN